MVAEPRQQAVPHAWQAILERPPKANDVKLVTLVTCVPDRVLTPPIAAIHGDALFTAFATGREEEAGGIVAGAAIPTSTCGQPDSGCLDQLRGRPCTRVPARPAIR